MLNIHNIYTKKATFNQDNRNKTNNNIMFQGLISKQFKITPDEFSKIKEISDSYHFILSDIQTNYKKSGSKMKENYPHLIAKENLKGFVFDFINFMKGNRLQIVRNNRRAGSEELITFGVLDNENRSIIRYRIDINGNGEAIGEDTLFHKLETNPFQQASSNINITKYVNFLKKELEIMKYYFNNYKSIEKLLKIEEPSEQVYTIIDRLQKGTSYTLKKEIEETKQNYENLNKILLKYKNDTGILKRDYLGDLYKETSRGTAFKIPNEPDKTITYRPITTTKDDRIFRLTINDRNNETEANYIFCSDGKIMRIKEGGKKDYFESWNLVPLSEEEIQENKIKDILKNLNDEIASFQELIIEKRKGKREYTTNALKPIVEVNDTKFIGIKEDIDKLYEAYNKLKNISQKVLLSTYRQEFFQDLFKKRSRYYQFRTPDNKIISILPETCIHDNRLFKLNLYDNNKKLENIFILCSDGKILKERILIDDAIHSYTWNLQALSDEEINNLNIKELTNIVRDGFEQFFNFINKGKETIAQRRPITKRNKLAKDSGKNTQNNKSTQVRTPKSKKLQTYENFFNENGIKQNANKVNKTKEVEAKDLLNKEDILTAINTSIRNIFDTPIENRAEHLEHKQLSSGRLFSGMFSFKIPNGYNITITKIKSPKYVDFIYYSIHINKKDENIILNIDPSNGKIMKSQNGKPVINMNRVPYIEIDEFLKDNKININTLNNILSSLS